MISADPKHNFTRKEWDVLDCWTVLFCWWVFPKKKFILDEERMSLVQSSCCGNNTQNIVYGDVGDVGKSKNCFICCNCVQADTPFGPLSPGCGCDENIIDDILEHIRERLNIKGEIATRKLASSMNEKVDDLALKVDAIIRHFNIDVPKTSINMNR